MEQTKNDSASRPRQGVNSIEIGIKLVQILAAAGRALPLKTLSDAAGIHPAKVHRYLVSLGRAGLVIQDPVTARYSLGSVALEIGLAAVGALDGIRLAEIALEELRDVIDETICLTAWGNHGVTVVRWVESSRAITVNVRTGTILPLLKSGSGRCFMAFLPKKETEDRLREEGTSWADVNSAMLAKLSLVRELKLARIQEDMLPGFSALAAPVFDQSGRIIYAMAALGPSTAFDTAVEGPISIALARAARNLSHQLGHRD